MHRQKKQYCCWVLIISALLTGCQPMQPHYIGGGDCDLSHYLDVATEIEYTDVDGHVPSEEVTQSHPPRTISNPGFDSYWDLTLEEAISHSLHNSKVIRTYGQVRQFGQILATAPQQLSASPDSVSTIYDMAIQETGQSGVEQALAAFDAIFSSNATWDNTDRAQNFVAANVNAATFQQDQVTINNEITKLTAVGSQLTFRNQSIYSGANNDLTAATRQAGVPSDWFTALEAEIRQPLLRNRGANVNRAPVVLARIRTDLSLIDFGDSVRELLSNVEHAYWELYFFYHNLKAAQIGRDSAQAAYNKVQALYDEGSPGGEAEKEAQAKEQYFFFRDRVEQAQRDVFKSEARIRYLMGLAPTDHRMIRPVDKPTVAEVAFDWEQIRQESLLRSGELRRQGFRIRQRELELIAARNQLLPQLDVIGTYRWLGVGDQFSNSSALNGDDRFPNVGSSAWNQLWDGNFQEFRLGFDMQMPLGFRREMSQVRSSQMALARERARLEDMELEMMHQLTSSIQDLDAGYRSVRTNFNRRVATEQQVLAVEAAYLAGTVQLDLLLDAQRRQADANAAYYQALVNYNLAIKQVHYRKGSLLDYNGVRLAEGPWPEKAYFDAANEARRRDASIYMDYGFSRPNVISRGKQSNRWSGDSQMNIASSASHPYGQDDGGEPVMADETTDFAAPESPEMTEEEQADEEYTDRLQNAIDSVMDEPTPANGTGSSDLPDMPRIDNLDEAMPGSGTRSVPPKSQPPLKLNPAPGDTELKLDLEAGRSRVRAASAEEPIRSRSRKSSRSSSRSPSRRSKPTPPRRPAEIVKQNVMPTSQADVIDIRWR